MDPPRLLGVLRGHTDAVNSVCFVENNVLSSGSGDGQLKLWNVSTKSSGRDGVVRLWDSNGESALESFPGCNHFCNASCDRNQVDSNLIAVSSECTFKANVWDIRAPSSQEPALSFPCNSHGMVMSVLLSSALHQSNSDAARVSSSSSSSAATSIASGCASSISLLVGCEDGTVAVFDCRKSCVLAELKLHSQPVFALDVSSSGDRILSGGADSDVSLCEVDKAFFHNSGRASTHRYALSEPGTSSVRVRGDGKLIVSTHWDATIRLFNRKLKPLGVLGQHRGAVNTVCFRDADSGSDDSGVGGSGYISLFATGSKDCTVALWSV